MPISTMAPNSSETGIVNKPDKEQNSAIQIFMELAGAMGTRQLICAAEKYIFTFFYRVFENVVRYLQIHVYQILPLFLSYLQTF